MNNQETLETNLTYLFYDYMAKDNVEVFDGKSVRDKTLTPVDLLWQETQEAIEDVERQIKYYEELIEENKNNEDTLELLKEKLKPLLLEKKHFTKSSMKYMKKLYKETGEVIYSRSTIRIPLYDTFLFHEKGGKSFYIEAEYLFYDDLGVNKGKYEEYKALKPSERYNFIKANTEITHIGLVINDTIIYIKGESRSKCDEQLKVNSMRSILSKFQ